MAKSWVYFMDPIRQRLTYIRIVYAIGKVGIIKLENKPVFGNFKARISEEIHFNEPSK